MASASPRPPKVDSSGWLTVFAVLCWAGAVAVGVSLGRGVIAYQELSRWQEVPVQREVSKPVRSPGEKKRAKVKVKAAEAPKAEYRYEYQGQRYTIRVEDLNDLDRAVLARWQRERQAEAVCYVNPALPEQVVLSRAVPWGKFLSRGGWLLALGSLGGGLIGWRRWLRRRTRQKEALVEAHPDEPWLWKESWARGVLRVSPASLLGPLLFAGIWSVMCGLMWLAFLLGEASPRERQVSLWFAIPFSLTEVGLLAWALVTLGRWRKYGQAVLEMASVPGVIGGQLAGVIRTPVKIAAQEAFCVRLSCIATMISQDSEDGGVWRSILWQEEQLIAHDLLQQDARHTAIPVLFQIPFECCPTDSSDPYHTVYWNLEVTAKTPGLDFGVTFEVPVFQTPQSDPAFVADPQLLAPYRAPDDPERDLRAAGVRRTPLEEGWRFVFPRTRYPGTALGLTVGSMLCLGTPGFWAYMDGGWIIIPIGILGGLFGLLLLYAALELWFYWSVVEVSKDGLTVRSGWSSGGSPQRIELAEITKFDLVSHMKSSQLVYYDLLLVHRDGRRVTLGKWLPGKRLATVVQEQIERVLLET